MMKLFRSLISGLLLTCLLGGVSYAVRKDNKDPGGYGTGGGYGKGSSQIRTPAPPQTPSTIRSNQQTQYDKHYTQQQQRTTDMVNPKPARPIQNTQTPARPTNTNITPYIPDTLYGHPIYHDPNRSPH